MTGDGGLRVSHSGISLSQVESILSHRSRKTAAPGESPGAGVPPIVRGQNAIPSFGPFNVLPRTC
jgi:hypothetical protein